MNGAHLRIPARAGIEVFVSASGPKTLELAGRIADGVILLVGLFTEALRWAVSQVERGAQAAGRARPHIAVFVYGAINGDEQAALEAARSIAAWFPTDRARHLRPGGPAAGPGRPRPGRLLRRRVPGGVGRGPGASGRVRAEGRAGGQPPARGRADRRRPQRGSRFGARLPAGGGADDDGQGVRRGLAARPGRLEGSMEEPARAWRVIRLHHVAFAHEGDDAPGC